MTKRLIRRTIGSVCAKHPELNGLRKRTKSESPGDCIACAAEVLRTAQHKARYEADKDAIRAANKVKRDESRTDVASGIADLDW